jgi:phosphoribosylformylglycinamidine synthase subunit PurS
LIARVVVTPKPVVNDPQGLTVKQGLNALGFSEVADVRVGKYIEVRLDAESSEAARERVEQMCRKLLANHVIEDFRLELEANPPPVLPPQAGRGAVGGVAVET